MESLELAADTEDETTLFLELRDLPRNPDDDAGYKALLAVGEKFSKTKGISPKFYAQFVLAYYGHPCCRTDPVDEKYV